VTTKETFNELLEILGNKCVPEGGMTLSVSDGEYTLVFSYPLDMEIVEALKRVMT